MSMHHIFDFSCGNFPLKYEKFNVKKKAQIKNAIKNIYKQ